MPDPLPDLMNEIAFSSADIAGLISLDGRFAPLLAYLPDLSWRKRPGGFEGLFRLIVEQQLSVAAAATIKGRIDAGLGGASPAAIIAADDELLRSFGLSRPKVSYAKALANSVLDGSLDFSGLDNLPSETAVARLTAIKGIGRWSAEVYLMFCEGHHDLFPVGDVALREALGWFETREARPNELEALGLSSKWSPYRSLASHALWAWYGRVKRGELPRSLSAVT